MTAFLPGVIIPPEAQPYCNSRGMIDWHAVSVVVCKRLNLPSKSIWNHHLTEILKGTTADDIGALPIMRELALDQVVNTLMVSRAVGSRLASQRRAERFAKDFGIDLSAVVGTGPGGAVLMRDVQAYRRGIRAQAINKDFVDKRILRQRRTLARHLLAALRESRALRAELEESQSRAAATALRLGNEIAEKISKIEKEYARVDAERACLELELSQTRINLELEVANARLQLEESRLTNDRLIARLSKQSRSRRVTHIRIGNELFRNRTGASA